MINWLKSQFKESNGKEAWDSHENTSGQQAEILKTCSRELSNQLILERKILFQQMLTKLGLRETTDCNGVKVLSSIYGRDKKITVKEASVMLERLRTGKNRGKSTCEARGH